MAHKTALVIGATGISGRALITHLEGQKDWTVIGVSRRPPTFKTSARFLQLDVTDREACFAAFREVPEVTHVFYHAYVDAAGWLQQGEINTRMFRNALDAVEAGCPKLQHVCLVQGSKYYGQHLGPYRTPSREDDPRHMPPNHYYNQQDYMAEQQKGKAWSWSCARPHVICGVAVGAPLNIIAVIGIFATISRELGLPLRYPGKSSAYRSIYQATDAGLLARAMAWMSTNPASANQAYNITNGDYFRYENLWPEIAEFFGMAAGPVQTIPLATYMADKEELWKPIQEKYDLDPIPYADAANWTFGDYALNCDWDVMSNTTKCRRHGFLEFVDSHEMYIERLRQLREHRIIP